MKHTAFTMIELVFVIVILGILAAIALPKLAATREDAEDSKLCHNIAVCITDMSAQYTAVNSASLNDSTTCSNADVSPLVSLISGGKAIDVSGAPSICGHLNGTRQFGGTRVSI